MYPEEAVKVPPHNAGSSVDQDALKPRCETEPSDLNAMRMTLDELDTGSGTSDPQREI